MKVVHHILIFVSLYAMMSCASSSYEKDDSSITVRVNSFDISLHMISPTIIRVTAAAPGTVLHDTSLMVVSQEEIYTDWEVETEDDTIFVKTSELLVTLNSKTGELCFKDTSCAVLLQEKIGGGKWMKKSQTEGADYYEIQQVFESPDDEAFYGLGAQHHRYMNYKGKDVELAQHNLVSCVPFLYSNKNYGLLWDNYSITRFGDKREYQNISNLTLYDAEGNKGGLTKKTIIDNSVVKTEQSSVIDYMFLEEEAQMSLTDEVKSKGAMVWEGYISSDVEGIHKFLLYGSSYIKLYVDGECVYDVWRQNWNPWSRPFELEMKKGEKYAFRLEWIVDGGFLSVKHLNPLPPEEQMRLSLYSEAGDAIDYYFIKGDNADDVIGGYRTLTGKAPIMPKWALGFWQSRQRYKTQDELLDVLRTYRQKNIPIDNIVLDWFYWPEDKWGSQTFDSIRFSEPEQMVNEVHDMNARVMISIWPKYYKGIAHYEEMKEHGYLFMRNIEKERLDWVYPGYQNTFYDVFSPGARDMFWKHIKPIYDKKFDAWWLDATEPDMHSNISIKERKKNMSPNHMGTGEEYFNAYSLLNAKGVYESQREVDSNMRVFILTRSSYAGQQRYAAANWSGDIVSRWSDLHDQISVGVNYCISGLPYWTMDIGGFSVEKRYEEPNKENLAEWRELQTRWFQFGAFCPLFRSHGEYPYREIFNVSPEGHPAHSSMVYYDKLRYALMPYIYTLAADSYHKDYTIMRGLVMDFSHDSQVLNITNQYMFGPSLLINPVTKYKARKRKVYLPKTTGWYDFYTGKSMQGGQEIVADAPYERMPIYVKAGSIIPKGVEMQYTNQYPDSVITVYVYAGADARFELYSDASVTYDYEKGKYVYIPFLYTDKTAELVIGNRKGSYEGMLEKQIFKIVYVTPDNAVGFDSPAISHEVKYDGSQISIQLQK
ncbi:MAG: DUF5110 domain-containing protein [Bacteroidales bacterium]|jgi:alpha-D-xyloside xylohydrolase|nr:DUF5110 domain-containing protein [Bacteroidales bacterium]